MMAAGGRYLWHRGKPPGPAAAAQEGAPALFASSSCTPGKDVQQPSSKRTLGRGLEGMVVDLPTGLTDRLAGCVAVDRTIQGPSHS